jgi:HAD superfamily hydrolase (TIGR01490 family)
MIGVKERSSWLQRTCKRLGSPAAASLAVVSALNKCICLKPVVPVATVPRGDAVWTDQHPTPELAPGRLFFCYTRGMQKVAFFDIDGTVFRSSLLIELVEGLIAQGHFPATAKDGYAEAFEAWRNREGAYDAYIQAVITTYLAHIRGVHYGDVADLGRQIVAVQRRRVYRYSRDLIKKLKAEGFYLVAISQSPKSVLDDFCTQYGFDKVYGRVYELGPQDQFTGVVVDEHLIRNKASIVKRVFDHNPALTREGSVAVGDTEGDIPLLESVENPICFNPNQLLYAHAKRFKWEVVVERKDVIYHL